MSFNELNLGIRLAIINLTPAVTLTDNIPPLLEKELQESPIYPLSIKARARTRVSGFLGPLRKQHVPRPPPQLTYISVIG